MMGENYLNYVFMNILTVIVSKDFFVGHINFLLKSKKFFKNHKKNSKLI